MYPEYPNLYQRARKATYFSQEEAAELLGLSTESMKQYESGRRTPSDDTVHRMAELYNLPWLELEHAKATDRLGVLPDVHIQPLPTASITLANRFRRASDQIYTLLEIAEDGIIDERERPEFDAIVADLRETIAAAYQVIYADGAKKERPDVLCSQENLKTIAKIVYHTRVEMQASFYQRGCMHDERHDSFLRGRRRECDGDKAL